MKKFYIAAALAAANLGVTCMADDLTAAKAAELLKPVMSAAGGYYYTEQGEPDFADLDGKYLCNYEPRIIRVTTTGNTASATYNHDRHFIDSLSNAWLADYAKMEAHEEPSLLFKTLKKNLEKWRTEGGGVDRADRPGQATFKLDATGWHVDSAPQE